MATPRQINLARAIVNSVGTNKRSKDLLIETGYAVTTSTKEGKVILNSKGVRQELDRYGFTEDKARRVVGHILNSKKIKPETRLKAAEQVFKVTGAYAPEKTVNLNVNKSIDPKANLLAEEYEQRLAAEFAGIEHTRLATTEPDNNGDGQDA